MVGAVELVVGLIMVLWPDLLIPLTARILAGWLPCPGSAGWWWRSSRAGARRASRPLVRCAILWSALILISIARARGDFDQTNPLTWVYVGAFGLTLVGISVLHLALETRHRKAKSRTAADTADNGEY